MLSIDAKRYVIRVFDLPDESAICENGDEVFCYMMIPPGATPGEIFAGFESELEAAAASLLAPAGVADE